MERTWDGLSSASNTSMSDSLLEGLDDQFRELALAHEAGVEPGAALARDAGRNQ